MHSEAVYLSVCAPLPPTCVSCELGHDLAITADSQTVLVLVAIAIVLCRQDV